jgi:hypothetical protein
VYWWNEKMTEYDAKFLEKLKQLCLEYDSKAGRWPENELEGYALYYFSQHPDYEFNYPYDKIDPEEEYEEELRKKQNGDRKHDQ